VHILHNIFILFLSNPRRGRPLGVDVDLIIFNNHVHSILSYNLMVMNRAGVKSEC